MDRNQSSRHPGPKSRSVRRQQPECLPAGGGGAPGGRRRLLCTRRSRGRASAGGALLLARLRARPRHRRTRLPWTTRARASCRHRDFCFARAKRASARRRSTHLEVVQRGRLVESVGTTASRQCDSAGVSVQAHCRSSAAIAGRCLDVMTTSSFEQSRLADVHGARPAASTYRRGARSAGHPH
jgi:hypothetical protein